ncbi:MAG: hypothetical protein U9Q83_09405, partial [Bacteroidota bacterium]|nr:hypothetical protein [Bacteroidota bacterium]
MKKKFNLDPNQIVRKEIIHELDAVKVILYPYEILDNCKKYIDKTPDTKIVKDAYSKINKYYQPCAKLHYCPYRNILDSFPLSEISKESKIIEQKKMDNYLERLKLIVESIKKDKKNSKEMILKYYAQKFYEFGRLYLSDDDILRKEKELKEMHSNFNFSENEIAEFNAKYDSEKYYKEHHITSHIKDYNQLINFFQKRINTIEKQQVDREDPNSFPKAKLP